MSLKHSPIHLVVVWVIQPCRGIRVPLFFHLVCVMYMLRFNLILGIDFISLCFDNVQ